MAKIKTVQQIELMRTAGRAVAAALIAMRDAIEPGKTTTYDLDDVATSVLKQHGAVPVLLGYQPPFSPTPYLFTTCISVNDEIVHGVPSRRRILKEGDIVSLDLAASVEGWCADAAVTVPVGKISAQATRLLLVAREGLNLGIASAKAGGTTGDIGAAIQRYVEKCGMSVVRDLTGHGIGDRPHEPELDVPNYGRRGTGVLLQPGMTLCIEPMINLGKADVLHRVGDEWTVATRDGSLSAHCEHTVAITENGPDILTLPASEPD